MSSVVGLVNHSVERERFIKGRGHTWNRRRKVWSPGGECRSLS